MNFITPRGLDSARDSGYKSPVDDFNKIAASRGFADARRGVDDNPYKTETERRDWAAGHDGYSSMGTLDKMLDAWQHGRSVITSVCSQRTKATK